MKFHKYLFGLLFAQLGVPLGLFVLSLVTGNLSLNGGFSLLLSSLTLAFVNSLVGIVLALPGSIIVGLPITYILAWARRLNLLYILIFSALVPAATSIILAGGVDFQLYLLAGFPMVCGALLYWLYLNYMGLLSSQRARVAE